MKEIEEGEVYTICSLETWLRSMKSADLGLNETMAHWAAARSTSFSAADSCGRTDRDGDELRRFGAAAGNMWHCPSNTAPGSITRAGCVNFRRLRLHWFGSRRSPSRRLSRESPGNNDLVSRDFTFDHGMFAEDQSVRLKRACPLMVESIRNVPVHLQPAFEPRAFFEEPGPLTMIARFVESQRQAMLSPRYLSCCIKLS